MLPVDQFRQLTVLSGVLFLAALSASAGTTTTTLAVTAAGSAVTSIPSGKSIALMATVKAGSTPVAPGIVNFCDAGATYCTDIHLLGTAQLTSAGTAVTHLVPGVGSHTYKAVFVGTNTNTGSSSAATPLSVTQSGPIFTGTNITQSGVAGGYTLTAAVGQSGNVSSPPVGTVSFLDTSNSNAVIGAATLGAMAPSLIYAPVVSPDIAGSQSLLTGDFDSDGIPDVLTADLSGNLAVLLGNGDGTFTSKASNAQLSNTDDFVAAGDFNADGKLDLFVTNYRGTTATILLGDGDGTFTALSTQPTIGSSGVRPVVADFNGDGNLDVALINLGDDSSTGTVLLGNGDGTFTGVHHPTLGPFDLVAADFNNDGKIDLAFLDDSENLCVLLGNGTGSFNALPKVAGLGSSISAIADFNGDGIADLIMLKYGQTANGTQTAAVVLLPGKGDGTFTQAATLYTETDPYGGPALGDFNGDGKPDLVISTRTPSYEEPDGTHVYSYSQVALLGQGDGTFTAQDAPTPILNIDSALAADFNGDGLTDILNITVDNTASGSVATLLTLDQSATATATGVTVTPSAGQDLAVASYAGDSGHSSSISMPTSLAARTVSVTPSLNFPATVPGDVSGYQQVTVTNSSASALTISSIQLSDNSPYSWGIREQACGTTLAAGGSCTFDVVFRPTPQPSLPAFINAAVLISDDAYGSPQQVFMQGEVVSTPAQVQLSSTSITFDPRYVGTVSGYSYVRLRNIGLQPMTIQSIAITNTSDFDAWGIRENNCPSTLPLYATCSFAVVFRPTHVGASSAEVHIKDNAGSSPQLITLTGTGK